MKENIYNSLMQIIKSSLKDLGLDKLCAEDLYLDVPCESRFGDLSTNIALKLSGQIKKSPLETAQGISAKIKGHLEKCALADYIGEVKIEGAGFINFYLNEQYFYDYLKNIKDKNSLKEDLGKGKKVLIEFVSANPTGPLSVAHARQAAVGDALANILNFFRFKVKKEYYLNDEGNQINILGKSIALRLKELSGEKIEFPADHYQGEYIYDIAGEIKNKKLEVKNFSDYGVEYILRIIKKELDDFGVSFDYWYSQKNLGESGEIKKALYSLKQKGLLYEKEGALWFKSTEFDDDKDRVVVKSDGSYTYLAPDIAYHRDKIRRGFNWLINLWGPDHHGYINRLKAAVEAQGVSHEFLSIIIVQLASIFREGKPVQMSTRKGQYITLREVLDEVGPDALRFFFLMRRTSSHLDFDLDIAKKHTPENPVFYVQYAHARICSVLRSRTKRVKLRAEDFTLLKEEEEMRLIKKIWQFSYILRACLKNLDPYYLTVYLQELSEDFHRFYDRHRILGEDNRLTCARLALIGAAKLIIATGLELLGVSRPEEM